MRKWMKKGMKMYPCINSPQGMQTVYYTEILIKKREGSCSLLAPCVILSSNIELLTDLYLNSSLSTFLDSLCVCVCVFVLFFHKQALTYYSGSTSKVTRVNSCLANQ